MALKIFSISLCLMICASCTTSRKPEVIVEYKPIIRRVPPALIRPCDAPWRKEGGPATVQDFVVRGDTNEAALTACAAKVSKIAEWDKD